MRTNKRNKIRWIVLGSLLVLILMMGTVFGKYANEFMNRFGLTVSPVEQNEVDHSLRRYFRSNELRPAAEGASYAVNGTEGWFSVSNGLDSSTVSEDEIRYTLTWYLSTDGGTWIQHQTQSASFEAGEYGVERYFVAPVTLEGTVYNTVKVVAKTDSFLQEDIEAVYTFTYTPHTVSATYADGVITLKLDTNDHGGDYEFRWPAGILPDNSDPNGVLTAAKAGPAAVTAKLGHNTAYELLFIVTDPSVIGDGASVSNVIEVTKK